jgi:hypothetical protein
MNMSIDVNSPLFNVLADWIKILLTLPDPPPEVLRQLNDVAVLTAVSLLSERLSGEVGTELRKAVPQLAAQVKAAAAQR